MAQSPETRIAEMPLGPAELSVVQARRDRRRRAGTWRLGVGTVWACVAVIALADLLIWRWRAPYAIEALLDEPAHIATGLLGLTAFGIVFESSVVAAVVAGSLLIDLDHLPHLFGSHILEGGAPRPYSHSLATVIVLLVIAVTFLKGRRRGLLLVATVAVVVHLFRDAAEPGGPGLAFLWPLSDNAVSLSYGWNAALVVGLAAVALVRRGRLAATV